MISSKSQAFESLYNFWPAEGMRNNNRCIPPRKSFETLGAHTNCNTSILFNTPLKHYDDYTELLLEDEVQSGQKVGAEDMKEQNKDNQFKTMVEQEQEEDRQRKMETDSNRFSQSCMPYSSKLLRGKSTDTIKSVDNRTRVDQYRNYSSLQTGLADNVYRVNPDTLN